MNTKSSRLNAASEGKHDGGPARHWRLLLVTSAVAVLVAACTASPSSTPPTASPGPQSLVVGEVYRVDGFDPHRANSPTTGTVIHGVYDTLLTFVGDNITTPMPSLATKWTISDDGKIYTFTLRTGVKFASGNALSSADVKYSLDRVKNLKATPAFLVNPIMDVQAPDPETVIVRLTSPFAAILPTLATYNTAIVDSKLVTANNGDSSVDAKDKDKADKFLNSQSAGSGPFVLTSYTPNEEIVLTKNANYWGEPAKLDRIVIRNILEPETQKLQVQRGDLDVATGIGEAQVAGLQGAANVTTKSSLSAQNFVLFISDKPDVGGVFANPKVQQALRYALDYDGFAKLAGTGAVRASGVIPSVFAGALPTESAPKTDIAKAKALLKEANVGDVKGQLTYGNDEVVAGVQSALIAQKVQSDLGAVGITITLNGQTSAISTQRFRDGVNQLGISAPNALLPHAALFLLYTPGRTYGLRMGWAENASAETKDLAKLALSAESETDQAKRTALYQQWEQKLIDIGPYIAIVQPARYFAFRSNLIGVTYTVVYGVDLRQVSRQ